MQIIRFCKTLKGRLRNHENFSDATSHLQGQHSHIRVNKHQCAFVYVRVRVVGKLMVKRSTKQLYFGPLCLYTNNSYNTG